MEKIKSRFVLFLILTLFWVLWNNTFDPLTLIIGAIVILITILLFGPSTDIFKGVKLTPSGLMYSFWYILVFIGALIMSNIDVLFRVLNPKLPIKPGIVRIETSLKSPIARLILANSITLTPGTFVVDIKQNYLYIHWIEVCCDGDPELAAKNISEKFEKILLKIYE